MPVNNYSVLKGDPQPGKVAGPSGKPPHYQIPVNAAGGSFQIAINIESDDHSQVLYYIAEDFTPPAPDVLIALSEGMNPLPDKEDPAIDFLRSRVNGQPLLTRAQMQLLPLPSHSAAGNLQNKVIELLNQATSDPNGVIYAFGGQYTGGTGIHEIHMNQGNPAGDHNDENGIWQDGGVFFELPQTAKWTAIFIAFQEQVWSTDDNGNPLG